MSFLSQKFLVCEIVRATAPIFPAPQSDSQLVPGSQPQPLLLTGDKLHKFSPFGFNPPRGNITTAGPSLGQRMVYFDPRDLCIWRCRTKMPPKRPQTRTEANL